MNPAVKFPFRGYWVPVFLVVFAVSAIFIIPSLLRRQAIKKAEPIHPVIEKLRKSDIELRCLFIPYRANHPPLKSFVYDIRDALVREKILSSWEERFTPIIDARESFNRLKREPHFFRDGFHLSETGADLLSAEIQDQLKLQAQEGGKVLFVGECYAVDIALAFQRKFPSLEIDALRSYDDPQRAIELMFKFSDIHLADTTLVVWVLPDRTLWHGLDGVRVPEKATERGGVRSVVGTVTEGFPFDYRNWNKISRDMPYPDALGEIVFTPSSDSERSENLILIQYCSKGRDRTGFEAIKTGDRIAAKLIDYDTHLMSNQKVGGEYLMHQVDDITLPRFWVVDWTKIDYSGEQW